MDARVRDELEQVILPFWLQRGIDTVHGGFHTCFDNRGRNLVSTDKYTWSQGRFVWLLAHAAWLAKRGLLDLSRLDVDADALVADARRDAAFLVAHAVGHDGTWLFVTSTDGTPTPGPNGETRSVYADCLVAMGLAELTATTGERNWLAAAEPIVARVERDIEDGTAPTPPYAVPPGLVAFGPRMILLNTPCSSTRRRWTGSACSGTPTAPD